MTPAEALRETTVATLCELVGPPMVADRYRTPARIYDELRDRLGDVLEWKLPALVRSLDEMVIVGACARKLAGGLEGTTYRWTTGFFEVMRGEAGGIESQRAVRAIGEGDIGAGAEHARRAALLMTPCTYETAPEVRDV